LQVSKYLHSIDFADKQSPEQCLITWCCKQ